MDFVDSIKNMFKTGQEQNIIPSIPIAMAKPLEGTKVRFWTKQSMQEKESKTTIGNSFLGEYKEGYFLIENDSWSENEIFSWTKYES